MSKIRRYRQISGEISIKIRSDIDTNQERTSTIIVRDIDITRKGYRQKSGEMPIEVWTDIDRNLEKCHK
jgi:hypothetical protein